MLSLSKKGNGSWGRIRSCLQSFSILLYKGLLTR